MRSRPSSKAHKSPIDCEADVPEHQVLDAWAADAHKRQEATIIFRNAATGTAWETLHLNAAYCVRYMEVFIMGDLTSGSYRCLFTLADPDGWTWNPGGPSGEAAVRPAARGHGSSLLVATLTAASRAGAGAKKTALVAGTAEHKAARWAQYQSKKAGRPGTWSEERWSKQ